LTTVADLLQRHRDWSVEHVFGGVGDRVNGLWEKAIG
jgi:hypothetical protein